MGVSSLVLRRVGGHDVLVLHLVETVAIAASPSEVFSWISDPERARRWQPDVKRYEVTRTAPGLTGTEFREWLGDGSGSLEMRGRITECVPDAAIAFEVSGGGVEVRSRYAVAGGRAGTTLCAELDFRVCSPASLLLEPVLRRRIRGQMRRELTMLRGLCEAEAAVAPLPG